jgi:DNA ligase (NAD+)
MTFEEIKRLMKYSMITPAEEAIKKLNDSYRNGNPEVTDSEYDELIEMFKSLDPTNEIFKTGVIEQIDVNSARKEKLKYPMFSLDKETEIPAIYTWLKNKGLPLTTLLVITAKYDGISILKDEYNQLAWSRGDGEIGETIHTHYKMLADKYQKLNLFTIGEMIIPKQVFASKIYYRDNGEPFKNARNMIAGLKNSDTISEDLKDAKHIRYGFASEDFTLNKSEQIDLICEKLSPIPYKVIKANELNIDLLNDLFLEWGKEYDIDGLVFDIDDKNIRKNLGRERNNNPAYARAFKNPQWSEAKETIILDIEWNISKNGLLKPVGILQPIDLDGVIVSRVTLNNAKFVKDFCIGKNTILKILRSGFVIPKVQSIIKSTGYVEPVVGNSKVFWNENGVELMVEGTEEQEIKKLISFFEILGAENVSEGIINQLYNSGYKTIKQILDLTPDDLEKLDRFGERKSQIVYESMHKSVTNVKLSKLMHATNIFKNLGSKKLDLLMHFEGKPTFEEILKVDGFSDISAKAYLDGYDEFYTWLSYMKHITIETEKVDVVSSDELKDKSFCFTGIRRKDLEEIIISKSGKVASGVSKNLTYLVCKDKFSGSSKLVKAGEIGVVLLSVEELENMLK